MDLSAIVFVKYMYSTKICKDYLHCFTDSFNLIGEHISLRKNNSAFKFIDLQMCAAR